MDVVGAGLLVRILAFLGRFLPGLRPARFVVDEGWPTVHVEGDIATVEYVFRLERGLFLWFGPNRYMAVGLPGQVAGVEMDFRRGGDASAASSQVSSLDMILDFKKCLRGDRGRNWKRHNTLEVSIRMPCNTAKLFVAPFPGTGRREVTADGSWTTFEVRRKSELRHIGIQRYSWDRSLSDLTPFDRILITKGEASQEIRGSITAQQSSSLQMSCVSVTGDGTVVPRENAKPIDTSYLGLSIPLSFEKGDEVYKIVFRRTELEAENAED